MKFKNIYFFITLLLLLISQISFAQEIPFVPPIYNYNTSANNGGNQNWAIAQDNRGIIYVANNRGLLSFDGINWRLHTLPNNIGVKSIFIDSSEVNGKVNEILELTDQFNPTTNAFNYTHDNFHFKVITN